MHTGQEEETALALYYYGARWYDPALGRFIQPDTIVPDPGEAKAFDRYAYVNNNPLKFNDPSGHIAVCFQGGDQNTSINASGADQQQGFLAMCQQSLGAAGYQENLYGDILYLNNGVDAIEYAYDAIHRAKAADPAQPVVIMGYSWGGAAALDLSAMLGKDRSGVYGDQPVSVDLLLVLDPENDLRWASGVAPVFDFLNVNSPASMGGGSIGGVHGNANARTAPQYVTENVKLAVNLYATKAVPPDNWTNYKNGIDNVRGALNIGLSEVAVAGASVDINHYSIVYTALGGNPLTQQYMTMYTSAALQGGLYWANH